MKTMTETVEDRIIKAASALFLRYGAKNITMDDIAKDLRMSKKTIYKYFTAGLGISLPDCARIYTCHS
ncbi:MAG: helix-turn-helix domain-containing protein [Balneolales bacterium]